MPTGSVVEPSRDATARRAEMADRFARELFGDQLLDSAEGVAQAARRALPSRAAVLPAARRAAREQVSCPDEQLTATQRIVCEQSRARALARRAVREAPPSSPVPDVSPSQEVLCEERRQAAIVRRRSHIGAIAASDSQVDRLLDATEGRGLALSEAIDEEQLRSLRRASSAAAAVDRPDAGQRE